MALSYTHVPGGANTLYRDGHVFIIKYQQENPYPINAPSGNLMRALYG